MIQILYWMVVGLPLNKLNTLNLFSKLSGLKLIIINLKLFGLVRVEIVL